MQVPWFDFQFNRPLGIGLVIGLVLGAFLRTVFLQG